MDGLSGWLRRRGHRQAPPSLESAIYREIIASMRLGYCLVEMVFDRSGRPVDYRFVEANEAFAAQTGLSGVVGRTARELVPDLEQWWIDAYARVASTGEPACFERYAEAMGRCFQVEAFRFGEAPSSRVVILFSDVSERKRMEDRDRFLIEFDDATRALDSPDEIGECVIRMLGRRLAVDRAAYIEVAEDEDEFRVVAEHGRGAASPPGPHRLSAFGAGLVAAARSGHAFIESDVRSSVLPRSQQDRFRAFGVRAMLAMPLKKKGRLAALVAVFQTSTRAWSAEDVDLLALFANRCWEAIERARIARAMQLSDERFKLATEAVAGLVFDREVPADRVWRSDGLDELVGLHPEECDPGFGWWLDRVHDQDRARLEAGAAPILSREAPSRYECEYRVRHRLGHWVPVWERGAMVRDDAGRLLRVVGTVTDMSGRKRAESALARQARTFDTALSSIQDHVYVFDRAGRLVYANRLLLAFWNLASDHAIGRTMSEIGFPESLERELRRNLDDVVRTAAPVRSITRHGGDAGPAVYFENLLSPVFDEERNVLLVAGVSRDVTAKQAEEATRENLLQEERAARVEAERAARMKDEFLATLSHELRTPLSAILGWTHLLRSGVTDRAEISRGLEVIDRNARVQTQLISDLLDVSRIVSGKMQLDVQPVDLHRTVESALESLRPAAAAKEIELVSALPASAGALLGDPSRLQQVIWNLVSNGIKFTPAGGTVRVELKRLGSQVEIRVADSGVGIDARFLPHVFERFTQADPSTSREQGGLGIGLSLVKQLVELHGGTVSVASEGVDRGTTFTVRLPVAARSSEELAHHAPSPPESSPPTPAPGQLTLAGLRVLIVEDEPESLWIVQRILGASGAEAIAVASAAQALETLQQRRFDMIVSDIGMPRMDGYAFMTEVRRRGHAQPAVALTAFARAEDRARAFVAGFQAHVSKPVDPGELVTTLAALQAG